MRPIASNTFLKATWFCLTLEFERKKKKKREEKKKRKKKRGSSLERGCMQARVFLFLHSWTPIKRANQGRWKGERQQAREPERGANRAHTHTPETRSPDRFCHLTPKQTQTKTNRERGKKRKSQRRAGAERSSNLGRVSIGAGLSAAAAHCRAPRARRPAP